MAKFAHWLKLATLLGVLALFAAPFTQATADVNLPGLQNHKGAHCVAPVPYIRRYHPYLLKHHRYVYLHEGIRTPRYNLTGCVKCHASKKTGSVAVAKDDFCVTCHDYVGVDLTCWQCHSSRPNKGDPYPADTALAAPMLTSVQAKGQSK